MLKAQALVTALVTALRDSIRSAPAPGPLFVHRRRCRLARQQLVGIAFVSLPTALAWGSDPATLEAARDLARQHFNRGVALVESGEYAAALQEFRRAYDLSPHHSVLFNIGMSYVALERPVDAVDTLQRYLKESGAELSAERRSAVKEQIEQQKALIAELAILTDVEGASVLVDGHQVGTTPIGQTVRVSRGTHRVIATAEDGARADHTLSVSGGQRHELTLKFASPPKAAPRPPTHGVLDITCGTPGVQVLLDGSPLGSTPLARPLRVEAGRHRLRFQKDGASIERGVTVGAGATLRTQCDVPLARREAEPSSGRSAQSTVGYVVGGTGLLLGAAAFGHLLWNANRYQDWSSRHGDLVREPDPQAQRENNELALSIERAEGVTVGLTLGAVAAVGTGLVLLLTDPGSKEPSARSPQARQPIWRGVW